MTKNMWHEKLYINFGQYFFIDKILYRKKNEYQDLFIFENSTLGRIMVLDDIIQTTEKDEFIYHEMMTHIPIISFDSVKSVLIIGGGDGGILREVSKYQSIEKIFLVELDKNVIDCCKKYLPKHGMQSWFDSRLNIIINNGVKFVNQCQEKFDIIISDCTDPIGPGKCLFTSEFYSGCKKILNKNGIFVAQNGVYFLQKSELANSYKKLRNYFSYVNFYQVSIPTYYGGSMVFACASDIDVKKINKNTLQKRFLRQNLNCRYYNTKVHMSSFSLPQYILNILI